MVGGTNIRQFIKGEKMGLGRFMEWIKKLTLMKEGAVLQRVDMKNKLVLHLIPQADENLHQLTERLHAFLRT